MAIRLPDSVSLLITAPVNYPWLFVVWVSAVMFFFLSIYLFGKRKVSTGSAGLMYGAVFALVGTIAIALVGAETLNPPREMEMLPGRVERIFMGAIPALTIGWIILFKSLHGSWLRICQATLVLLCFASLGHFYPAYSSRVEENKYHGSLLDEAIDAFFEQHPNGRVVCVTNPFASRYCSTAVAYNIYRDFTRLEYFNSASTKPFLPTWRLFDGRVIGLNIVSSDPRGNWDWDSVATTKRLLPLSETLLIVTEGGVYRDNLIRFFYDHQTIVIPFWRWWEDDRDYGLQQLTKLRIHNKFSHKKINGYADPNWNLFSPDNSFLAFRRTNKPNSVETFSSEEENQTTRAPSDLLTSQSIIPEEECTPTIMDLSGLDIREWNLSGRCFFGVDLHESKLIEADLRSTVFRDANLVGAKLSEVDLTDADLTGANLHKADLVNAILVNATLRNTYLWSTDLSYADLRHSNLSGSKLWQSQLIGADLRGANLLGADFSRANLSSANLTGTDLQTTNLIGTIFCRTIMPNGTRNDSDCN